MWPTLCLPLYQKFQLISYERNSCCPWCGSQISMENHKFRVIPKRKKSRRIHKLENKLRKGIHLPKNQRRHLLNFQSRTNHLRLSCKVCKKTFKYTGSMATLKGSKILKGGIRQLKTPENHPKQKSQMRHLSSFSVGTPSPSPAASTPSTPSTSSAKKQKQKWKHSRLQQILKTSKQQQSPSSVLQGFLSSI
ncbi:UPF0711 protein C18orf21 homolog isoform X2 [Ptychodera flava]|uniref:UPF0711 protein C18orf21 homolog isoform X2 n=1 Tax=Ptychodera flava TaxID=63121 RepID=UPI00396A54B2